MAAEQEYEQAIQGTRAEALAVAAARVDEARARVDAAAHELTKTELVAPWMGSIVRRNLSVGDYVDSGGTVFELVDLANLEVHIEVPGRFASRVGDDSEVRLTLPGDRMFSIRTPLDAQIASADEEARSFRAIVRLDPEDDPERHLKPGVFVEVELGLERVEGELVVPSDAVLAGDAGSLLVRAVPGDEGGLVAEFVPVRVLAQSDGLSAIVGLAHELAVGDRIVLTGADNAFPGAGLLPPIPPAAPVDPGSPEDSDDAEGAE